MVVTGPTAVGKSAVAHHIAKKCQGCIVSADSMMVYRSMDIGTAKPTIEERREVPHIGLDCVPPSSPFSVGDWLCAVRKGLKALKPDTPVIVAGGTGLYIKALLEGLESTPSDPSVRRKYAEIYAHGGTEALQREAKRRGIDLPAGDAMNPRRLARALERDDHLSSGAESTRLSEAIMPICDVYVLSMDRAKLFGRILARTKKMFESGLIEEAASLPMGSTARQAIGYREALAVQRGEMSIEEAIETVSVKTRQYAKRQETWLRHQFSAKWLEIGDGETVEEIASRLPVPGPMPA